MQKTIANEAGTQTTTTEYADENLNNLRSLLTGTISDLAPGIIDSGRAAGLQAQENYNELNDQFLPAISKDFQHKEIMTPLPKELLL